MGARSADPWRGGRRCDGGSCRRPQRPNRTRFRDYAIREHRAHSYRYSEPLRADVVLPEAGVTYYDVPPEYSVRDYRYTVVNETPVLVEPRKRRVIEVIE